MSQAPMASLQFEPAHLFVDLCCEDLPLHSMLDQASEIPPTGPDRRGKLVRSLRGQHINIPDLHGFFPSWPNDVNHELEALRNHVDRTLDRYELSLTFGGIAYPS